MRFDREELCILPKELYFLYGFNFAKYQKENITYDEVGNILLSSPIHYTIKNGWYFILRFKFIKKMKKWQNPETFDYEMKKCFPVFLFSCRKPFTLDKFIFTRHFFWVPVN